MSIPDVWLDTGHQRATTVLRRLVHRASALRTHTPKDNSRRPGHPVFLFESRNRKSRLVGGAYVYRSQPHVLCFELRGSGDGPPNKPEAYFARVKRYFAPLLADSELAGLQWGWLYYGRRHLPSKADALLHRFAAASRRPGRVKIEWDLFDDFVMYCHVRRVKLKADDFRHFLAEEGIDGTQLEELVTAYGHGRRLLGKRCWRPPEI